MAAKEKRKEIYDFIVKFITDNGYSPTVREIKSGVGLQSTSSVYNHLWKLSDNGLITLKEKEPRTITLVGYKFVKVDDTVPKAVNSQVKCNT